MVKQPDFKLPFFLGLARGAPPIFAIGAPPQKILLEVHHHIRGLGFYMAIINQIAICACGAKDTI
jgi:hypothetical protein